MEYDYVVSKPSCVVSDSKGRILFAGNDTDVIQWTIDKVEADNKKWYNRLLRWIRLKKGSIKINFGAPEFFITKSLELTDHVEFHGLNLKPETKDSYLNSEEPRGPPASWASFRYKPRTSNQRVKT